jgi:replicative DNA helicase
VNEPETYHILTTDDCEREIKVLTGMLRLNSNIEEVQTLLVDEDFLGGEHSLHRHIFKAIKKVYQNDPSRDPIDAVAVIEEIDSATNMGQWQTNGVAGKTEITKFLAGRLLDDPIGLYCRWNAQKVKESAIKRVLFSRAGSILRELDSPSMSLDEFIAETQQEIAGLTTTNVHGNFVSMAQALRECQDEIDRRQEGLSGVTYGLERLDSMTDGAHAGQLIMIGARPSVGKSAFGLCMARRAAEVGNNVAFFSVEQSTKELAFRLLSGETGISSTQMRRHSIRANPTMIGQIISATERMSPLGIYFNDSATQTVRSMHTQCRRLQSQYDNFRLVVVDYAQIITPNDRGMPRYEQIGEISRSLKIMARNLNLAVVVMAQLHRKQEDREYDEPKLSDFRESGSLEQDADVAIMLWRPKKPEEHDEVDEIKAKVAKQRNGPCGIINLGFRKATMMFENYSHNIR